MNLNRIIKKVIKESVRKKLNESNKSSNDDFFVLKTKTGGTLLIPKSSEPKILSTVNKPEFKKQMRSTAEINNFAKNNSYKITENCKKFYKDITLDACYASYVNWYYSTLSDGGVIRFEATSPSDGKRYVFRACTNSGDNIKFEDRKLSGYYPNVALNTMICTGNPWTLNQSDEKNKSEFSMKFNIKLQMIK